MIPFSPHFSELFIKNAAFFLEDNIFTYLSKLFIGIFYPTGESISLHRVHRSLLAVADYSFAGHFFAAASILNRE
jgi:hypothetical protein